MTRIFFLCQQSLLLFNFFIFYHKENTTLFPFNFFQFLYNRVLPIRFTMETFPNIKIKRFSDIDQFMSHEIDRKYSSGRLH